MVTEIAGIVGVAERVILDVPVKVEELDRVPHTIGGPFPEVSWPTLRGGFFANGGRTAGVVRVGVPDSHQKVSPAGQPSGPAGVRVWARDHGPGNLRDPCTVLSKPSTIASTLMSRPGGGQAEKVWRRSAALKKGLIRTPWRSEQCVYVCDLIGEPGSQLSKNAHQ